MAPQGTENEESVYVLKIFFTMKARTPLKKLSFCTFIFSFRKNENEIARIIEITDGGKRLYMVSSIFQGA